MSVMEMNARGAGGRPSLARKGDVDARLLEAATRLFLTLGFEGTSCDLVAQEARAGKASIYARYANKTALLAAVVKDNLERLFDPGLPAAAAAPLRERMRLAGETVIAKVLQPDAVALLRLLVAEAQRLSDIAVDADAILRRIGIDHVAQAITGQPAAGQPDGGELDAAAPAAALLDLILMPALLRGLLGADPAALQRAAIDNLMAAVDTVIASDAMKAWR
jgi:AcrR family transcriptional regulator